MLAGIVTALKASGLVSRALGVAATSVTVSPVLIVAALGLYSKGVWDGRHSERARQTAVAAERETAALTEALEITSSTANTYLEIAGVNADTSAELERDIAAQPATDCVGAPASFVRILRHVR